MHQLRHFSVALAFVAGLASHSEAQSTDSLPAISPESSPSFTALLTSQTRETFAEIRKYLEANPAAADRTAAAQWVLETARENGWEHETQPVVAQILSDETAGGELKRLAWSCEAIGAAREGMADRSGAAFQQFLRSLRLRQPNLAAELAQSIALAWQLRGDVEQAAKVYEQLTGGFFLNDELQQFAADRVKRLSLVGQLPPEISQADLAGNAIEWQAWRDRTVILDFWATNCRPCLEEFPRLKRRAAEFAPLGVDVLGVSFDAEKFVVEEFMATQPLPWRQVLARETAQTDFHVRLIPCLMLVGPAGKVAATDVRPADLRWAVLQVRGGGSR